MLKWFIRSRLAAFERKFGYDVSYARAILDADLKAFFAMARLGGMGEYRRDVPREVYWGARLQGSLAEDCGPCTQLNVTMALADGVRPATIAAVLSDAADVPEEVRLGVRFARAAIAHDPAADELREEIEKRWGKRAVVSLSFAIATARLYPTLKYALGYGKTCQRVVVGDTSVVVARTAA